MTNLGGQNHIVGLGGPNCPRRGAGLGHGVANGIGMEFDGGGEPEGPGEEHSNTQTQVSVVARGLQLTVTKRHVLRANFFDAGDDVSGTEGLAVLDGESHEVGVGGELIHGPRLILRTPYPPLEGTFLGVWSHDYAKRAERRLRESLRHLQ